MRKNLAEQLERIHRLNYGKKVIKEGFMDDILKSAGIRKVDDPKKADLVDDQVDNFFETLELIDAPLFQKNVGNMEFQKDVESVQIGLKLLGYKLPNYGVDGLFGSETAMAVNKFKLDNNIKDDSVSNINEASLESPISLNGVTSQYGVKRGNKTHPGVDLKASSGTEIKSPSDGKVIDSKFSNGACGGTIQIEHGNGFISRYCHCKEIRVNIGQSVKQGEVIGLSGGAKGDKGAGSSTGPHLHFELKKNGQLVDPLDYIGKDVGTYDFSKSGGSSKSVITLEMIKVLVNKLKNKGVSSEDLKKNIDTINVDDLADRNFYAKILENLNAPITEENMKFMYAWRQSEGKGGTYNPFNTSWDLPGSTNYNKHRVKNYKSLEDGMIATIKTLKHPRYSCIVNGLREDIGADQIARCESLKIWGTGDLVLKVVNSYNNGAKPKLKSLS
jgi:murein DD-endopeptidase MepM/ murein hydrolase activator NlpD